MEKLFLLFPETEKNYELKLYLWERKFFVQKIFNLSFIFKLILNLIEYNLRGTR